MLSRLNPAHWTIAWPQVLDAALLLAVAVAAAWLVFRLAFGIATRLARLSESTTDDVLVAGLRRPVQWAAIAIGVTLAAQANPLLASLWEPLGRFVRPALLGWIAYALVKALTAVLDMRLQSSTDAVAVRSRRTRIAILSRTASFGIVFITAGLMLMGIPGVRDIGTTVLASAGLAALAVGAAAQPALKSLIAGLQMAITEPLRLGDLVVVDGQTGRVEEIRMSFVVVRTWDERAVIVPTSRFLDTSFENWSRTNEMLTGPVFLHLDPATEIEPVRAEFLRFVREQPTWDGRTASALLTEAFPESVQLRLAMSSHTIGQLFELRCAVREHMIAWLRQQMPGALIRRRLEVDAANQRVEP